MRDNWRLKKIADLVDIRVSNVDKKIHSDEIEVSLCNYMDAYNNDYLSKKTKFSEGSVNHLELSKFTLEVDDVIITKDSETPEDIAVSSVVMDQLNSVVCGYHLAILRPEKAKIYGQFLMHKLKLPSVQKLFYRIASGSTRYGLTIGGIKDVKISIPDPPQQRKIAKILSTCDTVIEKTEAAIAKYQSIKKGMMHDLFTRGIDLTTGKLRPKYEDAPGLYKESGLGMIPKEWEVRRINEISTLVTNGFVGVATPFYTDKENGVLYLFGTNVRSNFLDFNDIRYVSFDFHNTQKKSQLKEGDMLTVQSGHIGISAVIPEDFGGANCHALIITRFIKEKVNANFISYYINSDLGVKYLEKLFIGSTVKHINTSDLAKHKVPLPNVPEQNLIANKLIAIQINISHEQSTLSKYRQFKAGLMQDLLTGKVEVKVKEELNEIL
jgi:type I restriction enzyme S subunit